MDDTTIKNSFARYIIKKVVRRVDYDPSCNSFELNRIDAGGRLLDDVVSKGSGIGLSREEALDFFYKTCDSIQTEAGYRSVDTFLSVGGIKEYEHLRVVYNHLCGEQTLELLKVDVRRFMVLSSSLMGLRYKDEIISLVANWRVGHNIAFIIANKPDNRYNAYTIGPIKRVDFFIPPVIYEILDSQEDDIDKAMRSTENTPSKPKEVEPNKKPKTQQKESQQNAIVNSASKQGLHQKRTFTLDLNDGEKKDFSKIAIYDERLTHDLVRCYYIEPSKMVILGSFFLPAQFSPVVSFRLQSAVTNEFNPFYAYAESVTATTALFVLNNKKVNDFISIANKQWNRLLLDEYFDVMDMNTPKKGTFKMRSIKLELAGVLKYNPKTKMWDLTTKPKVSVTWQ